MRNTIVLFVLIAPSLAFGGVAQAATRGDVGKPVCNRYEEAAPKAAAHAAPTSSTASTVGAGTAANTSSGTATSGMIGSGGGSSDLRPHDGPRWQAFLPGMFR
ncbi:MAG: hypothetical protein JSR26_00775 [Proteobacteria bacterium]|nr:hypothetical protein [Pseudomonadota bacterium]